MVHRIQAPGTFLNLRACIYIHLTQHDPVLDRSLSLARIANESWSFFLKKNDTNRYFR
jgi:hypothetical protein